MGIRDKIKGLFLADRGQEKIVLFSPLDGRIVPLEEVADETFATKILGDGVAVLPSGNVLCAPMAARVAQTFDSGHAVTLMGEDGVELLLHIGIDTVKLKGEYFDILVKEGERVAAGDALIRFDREKIKARGFDVTTPMIVSNAYEYDLEIAAHGEVAVGTPLLRLKRKERIG